MGMKLARLVVAALLPLTLVTIVQTSTASAVTYGDPIENPQIEFPEVVPLWVGGSTLCSGTLVTQQVVLTAAHCVYGQSGPFQISVGGSTLNNGRLIDVDATWYHPRYDAAFSQNDIALLHLKTPAGVSRLGVLPKSKMKSLGKKFLIVGWGRDQNGMITGKLHQLSLNDQSEASRKFFKSNFNPKTMVGAGRYFADEILYGGGCTGDSGGPLYQGAAGASRTILGLTSFGARGCTVYQPTVFTRVDFYVSDINKGIQLLNSRASSSPIATGKATPAGIGPTTTTSSTSTTTTTTTTSVPRTTTTFAPTTTTTVLADLVLSSWNGKQAIGKTARNTAWIQACFYVNDAPWSASLGTGGGQSPVSGTTHCIKNDYLTGWSTFQGDVNVWFTPYTYTGKYTCTFSTPCNIYVVISDALGRSVTSSKASLTLP